MAAGAPALETRNKIALYKIRSEEYRRRYETMRSLEWKVLFQAYAGYAAITIGFSRLDPKFLNYKLVTAPSIWLIMWATFLFFAMTQYLSFRIQERLIVFGVTYENWNKKISSLEDNGKTEPDQEPGPGIDMLGHPYFWTYDVQLFLALLTCVGVLCYEAMLRNGSVQESVLPPVRLLCALVVLACIYTVISKWFAKLIHKEALSFDPSNTEQQPTLWRTYVAKRIRKWGKRDQKKSGTPVTGRT